MMREVLFFVIAFYRLTGSGLNLEVPLFFFHPSLSQPPFPPPISGVLPPSSGCLLLDTLLGRHDSECIIMLISHHPSPLASIQHSREVEEVFLLETKIPAHPVTQISLHAKKVSRYHHHHNWRKCVTIIIHTPLSILFY